MSIGLQDTGDGQRSHGHVLEVFFKDFQEVPLHAAIVPSRRTADKLAAWGDTITRLRLGVLDHAAWAASGVKCPPA